MFRDLKQTLRRRLFGRRMYQRLVDDDLTISRLGVLQYQNRYPGLKARGFTPSINAFEFSYYSQNGEDGIILYLLSRVGSENHFMVEIGTEDGRECNSANLILNFGWQACLIETSAEMATAAQRYFTRCNAGGRVQILNARAAPDNINELLLQAGVPRQLDILSIDIDSYDYWLWEAIDVIEPRIVVIEYNASFGPALSVTIPSGKLPSLTKQEAKYYHGASITALQRLGKLKGYDLIGGDSKGINAFFVRHDLAASVGLDPEQPAQVHRPHFWRTQKNPVEKQLEIIKGFTLTEVK